MTTTSSLATLQTIRAHLLAWNTNAVQTAIGTASGAGSDGKLYIDQAPDAVSFPYGVLRILDRSQLGDDGGYAFRLEVELHLYHRPRVQLSALRGIADLCERALRGYRDLTAGVIVSRNGLTRATILYEEPADRDLVCERLVCPFYVHETLHVQDAP